VLVRDGDPIRIDAAARTLDLLAAQAEIKTRRGSWTPRPPHTDLPVLSRYARLVGPAYLGAVTH
jgi:dihydroxy-acid dehydratase